MIQRYWITYGNCLRYFLPLLLKNRDQKIEITCYSHFNHFLPLLLASLLEQSYFCFGSCFGTIGLAISEAKSKGNEVAVGFIECFL